MLQNTLRLVAGLTTLLVVWVEGVHLFTLWNLAPVIGAAWLGLRQGRLVSPPAFAFGVVVSAVEGLFHLAWQFDWGGTATGSSTSAIAFAFIPVLAIVAGAIGAGVSTLGWR